MDDLKLNHTVTSARASGGRIRFFAVALAIAAGLHLLIFGAFALTAHKTQPAAPTKVDRVAPAQDAPAAAIPATANSVPAATLATSAPSAVASDTSTSAASASTASSPPADKDRILTPKPVVHVPVAHPTAHPSAHLQRPKKVKPDGASKRKPTTKASKTKVTKGKVTKAPARLAPKTATAKAAKSLDLDALSHFKSAGK